MLQRKRSLENGQQQQQQQEEEEAEVCAFCLDQLQNPVKLRCNHSFCRSCLEIYREARSWVAERCPLCRRTLEEHRGLEARSWKGTWSMAALILPLLMLSLGTFYLLLLYW
ncbi:tripartite motif-containing protein 75 [Drosophila guanche]|uniref:Blast:Tripartite motif-containing protein 75 n=1 Tax=Drosophila guanche TaxID=7266 RepID=A0A3B0IZP0_DROGU|nr:tripartite motif-containing protein 75 [Drosophila guanche]SPP73914.1 blast:Tripartite motif-containing protein 75 [Drosophila guanche]